MDYTTLAKVKLDGNIALATDDARLTGFITDVSRAIDRKLTGENGADSNDYLKLETVTHYLNGRLDINGNVIVNAHKPVVTAVSELSYRFKPSDSWIPVDNAKILLDGLRVEGWTERDDKLPCRVLVKMIYSGGLSATAAALPADVINAATVLVIRYWKEAQSGLADSIGIAELGQLMYTKAWPVRVLDMLQPYVRPMPWRGI